MDAGEWEQSQSRRSSIKRPWEEDTTAPATLPQHGGSWNTSILPPIDAVPYRRTSLHQAIEPPVGTQRYHLGKREPIAKKARYEGDDYRSFARDDLGVNTEAVHLQPLSHSPRPLHRASIDSSNFPQRQQWERQGGEIGNGPAALDANTSTLCSRCRRLTRQQRNLEPSEDTLDSKPQELLVVTQSAVTELTKLLNTLSSSLSSTRRDSIRDQGVKQLEIESTEISPIGQLGLKQSLDWLLGRLYSVNELAGKLVQHVPLPPQFDEKSPKYGANLQDGIQYSMKRRIDADPDDSFLSRGNSGEPSDQRLHMRRKSVATIPNSEEQSTRSQHEYPSMHSSSNEGPSRRASIMNPPPAPGRQLPSPPGRSLPSPTSINFPSPSAVSYLPQSIYSSSSNCLPPINSSTSDSALQAHSAVLRHEVSVQKIALSSLQGEHDKLLAAFSKSQLRASALEEKHAVSDNEIISLSEEKLRLQIQVSELEKEVEDLSRSRQEVRETAVRDGAQYVELVKNASRLEELGLEERKRWQQKDQEAGQADVSLRSRREPHPSSSAGVNELASFPIPIEISTTSPFSTEATKHPGPSFSAHEIKIESNESRSVDLPPTSNPPIVPFQQYHSETKDLKEEINRLRSRCTEVEDTLRTVRDESKSVVKIVQALGLAGKSIRDEADRILGDSEMVSGDGREMEVG